MTEGDQVWEGETYRKHQRQRLRREGEGERENEIEIQGKKGSQKAWLDDSFMCLNLFYSAAPVHSPTTIGGNFPCVDKLHGSLGKQHTPLRYYEKKKMLFKKRQDEGLREKGQQVGK